MEFTEAESNMNDLVSEYQQYQDQGDQGKGVQSFSIPPVVLEPGKIGLTIFKRKGSIELSEFPWNQFVRRVRCEKTDPGKKKNNSNLSGFLGEFFLAATIQFGIL